MPQPQPLQVTVYTPGSALRQPSRLLADLFRDVWRGRGLAWRLAVRDISAQYRQTALGLLWALILPLTPLILIACDWLTGLPGDVLDPFLLVNAILLVLLLFMGSLFRLAMPMLIERMGS
ncbi:hypothetical protein [Thiorhodovibrio frisius]|uniref:Uncharacterized protein n=1 Tax=Thiorhodovibrio frisius TaxID=631362 RepID=H8Z0S0_9GAMM|nr:hypothetical protein [Thiorhodovibrio frisius]EIC21302.1 hypothetical protein Thi970DRAFT_01505 [Thiorhodovibrio frisius]WPL23885.1 hypothetical protein Thiofri_04094 [Thiorhodovibrio frisius]